MKIGIDLSSLQGPHRMRGIGYTLIHLINTMPTSERKKHAFVFYLYPEKSDEALAILDLTNMTYEVRHLRPKRRITKRFPGKLRLVVGALNQVLDLRDLYSGDSRITNLAEVEYFLQTDQSQSLPKGRHLKKGLILYDVIPYALENDYLWSYKTARKKGFPRKSALRVGVRRRMYGRKLKVNARRADQLFAISKQTKTDFIAYLSVPAKKITVTPLGVTLPDDHTQADTPQLQRYEHTSWGYIQRPFTLDLETPFLLFVGGADRRRKLQDLVTAFNHLRAQGHKLQLVLSGDSMQGPNNISTEEIQDALKRSSYLDDIVFLGFASDAERDWLYRHALAFVFPSRYEGFGLPVLEAMAHHCLVISYRNGATVEVAGDAPFYVNNAEELVDTVKEVLSLNAAQAKRARATGLAQAEQYRWTDTTTRIMHLISGSTR
jgi:glycosyltransferase involved in cell wall biosynthesis